MRCALLFMLAVFTLPESAVAQADEEGTSPEPALRLELTPESVGVVPSPPRTVDGYTLKQMEKRVQRAKRGLGVSVVPFVAGGILMTVASLSGPCFYTSEIPKSCNRSLYAGVGLTAVGAAGMIATGVLLGVRKRKLRTLREAEHGTTRRLQWDLETSRLVF